MKTRGGGVSPLFFALPFALTSILSQKKKKKNYGKLKYFTMPKYNLQKNSSKTNQNPYKIFKLSN
jgi:hypothetical protein